MFSFIIIVLQPRKKPGEEGYDPYDWESEEEAEDGTERRKLQGSSKPVLEHTSESEVETGQSHHDDTAAGPSTEPPPAIIADDR